MKSETVCSSYMQQIEGKNMFKSSTVQISKEVFNKYTSQQITGVDKRTMEEFAGSREV